MKTTAALPIRQEDNPMRMYVAIAIACAVVVVGAAAAQDQKLVSKGQRLTVDHKCSMCHVLAGKGGKIGKPLDGVSERRDAAALGRALRDPLKEFPDAKVKMTKVAWAPGEVDAVIAYLQTLKAPPAK
jgi:cytochrome c2